jgi:branched-chain amino acid transport system permease protein
MALFMTPLFFAYGYLFFKYLLEPLSKKNHFESTVGTVLVTVGALLIMSDLTAKFAGPAQKNINLQFDTFEIAGVIISTTQIIILLGIILLTLALHYFLRLTWYGRAVKAALQLPRGLLWLPGRLLRWQWVAAPVRSAPPRFSSLPRV